jgi:hypothetical protein
MSMLVVAMVGPPVAELLVHSMADFGAAAATTGSVVPKVIDLVELRLEDPNTDRGVGKSLRRVLSHPLNKKLSTSRRTVFYNWDNTS